MLKDFKYFEWPLFVAVVILSLSGLMMIYSTGLSADGESHLWIRQVVGFLIGMGGLIFFSGFDYRFFKKTGNFIYIFSILLLISVLFIGLEIRGSKRWLDLFIVNFQVAEFSKLALIILLARYFHQTSSLTKKFRYALSSFLYVLVPVVLIMFQPDLGSAIVHIAIWLGMLVFSPMPRKYFLYLLVCFLIVSSVAWQFFLADYQKDRVRSFIDPTADPLGRGYNVIQSIVAVGSGGVFGHGLARGLQSQLQFLPERQTDFIFASTVEELGLLGGGLVIILVIFILYRILNTIRGARDLFGMYLASGIFFLIFTQAIVNIGMNLGLLPVTGITLPFLSFGSSSLVFSLWMIGIIENISKKTVPVRFK